MDVNFKSVFYLCRDALPYMTRPGSNIVLMSSIGIYGLNEINSSFTTNIGIYVISKFLIAGLTKVVLFY